MKIDFKWNRPITAIAADVAGDDAQRFLANEAKLLMDPYVPALNNVLAKNARVYVENGKGIVHYQSPYARYQYYGKVMVSKHPGVKESAKKVLQPEKNLNYTKFRHPLATSHWDKAMLAARSDDLVRAMQNYLEGKQ